MTFQDKNIFWGLLGIPTLTLSLFCFAANKTVITEPFSIKKHGKESGLLAVGHSKITVHTRDSDGAIIKIEKKKTSDLTLETRGSGPNKVSITYTISLSNDAILSAHLIVSPEKAISKTPDIQKIIETGYLKIWDHIMASRKIEMLLEVNKKTNKIRITFKVNDKEKYQVFSQNENKTDNICRAILATKLISSIYADNPIEEFTGINFILALHHPITFKRDYERGKTADICHKYQDCPTKKINYKGVTNIGFTTGYRFCHIHKNYSLGYYPIIMHLLQQPVKQQETNAIIGKPESIFVHASGNTPMIVEALQGQPFLFLEEVYLIPTFPLFLEKTGFELLATKYGSSTPHVPRNNEEHMQSAQFKKPAKFSPFFTFQPFSLLDDMYYAMPQIPTTGVSVKTVVNSEEGMSSASVSLFTPEDTFNMLQGQVNGISRPNK